MKTLTRKQLESRKEKAARFTENVLGDPDRADEIADESLEDYAERRRIQIVGNPHGATMPTVRLVNPPRRVSNARQQMNPQSGRSELLARLRVLQEENNQLQDKLDRVAELAEAPEDDAEETHNDLVDALNEIIDVVAPEDEDEDDHRGND